MKANADLDLLPKQYQHQPDSAQPAASDSAQPAAAAAASSVDLPDRVPPDLLDDFKHVAQILSAPSPGTSVRPLRVGTDCSGLETVLWALHALGKKFDKLFSSDSNKHVKSFIKAI